MERSEIRLRPINIPEDIAFALTWYRDPEVLFHSEGPGTVPYDAAQVEKMYRHLCSKGSVYAIEVLRDSKWLAIGDAALCFDCLPIVIGIPEYRNRGLGKIVLSYLVEIARQKKMDRLIVNEVYSHNIRSQRLFAQFGFQPTRVGGSKLGEPSWSYEFKL